MLDGDRGELRAAAVCRANAIAAVPSALTFPIVKGWLSNSSRLNSSAWYVLRTGDEQPDWDMLGADYFVAPWEMRRFAQKKGAKEEEKKEASKIPADAVGK